MFSSSRISSQIPDIPQTNQNEGFNQVLTFSDTTLPPPLAYPTSRFGVLVKDKENGNTIVDDVGYAIYKSTPIGTDEMGLLVYKDKNEHVSKIAVNGQVVPVRFKYLAYKPGDEASIRSKPVAVYKQTGLSLKTYMIEPELDRKGIENFNGHLLTQYPHLQREISRNIPASLSEINESHLYGAAGQEPAAGEEFMVWKKMSKAPAPKWTYSFPRHAALDISNHISKLNNAEAVNGRHVNNGSVFLNAENVTGIDTSKVKNFKAPRYKINTRSFLRNYDVVVPHTVPTEKITSLSGWGYTDIGEGYSMMPEWRINLLDVAQHDDFDHLDTLPAYTQPE